MKGFWWISIILIFSLKSLDAQMVFAGYVDFERLNQNTCFQRTQHKFTGIVLNNSNAVFTNGIMSSRSVNDSSFQFDDSVQLANGIWRHWVSHTSNSVSCGFPNLLEMHFHYSLDDTLLNDTFFSAGSTSSPVVDKFPLHEFQKSNKVNVAYPLVFQKGKVFNFHPLNQFDKGSLGAGGLSEPGRRPPRDGITESRKTGAGKYSLETIGTYLFGYHLVEYNFSPSVGRGVFFTINVVDSVVPSGRLSMIKGEALPIDSFAEFLFVPNQKGKVDLEYTLENADSAVFSIAAGDNYYAGIELKTLKRQDSVYSLELTYADTSRIITEESSFINVLVKEFWHGQPYYSTFTIGFEPDTSVGTNQQAGYNVNQIDVYPNPCEDHITAETNGFDARQLELFDLLGRKVHFKSIASQETIQLNLSRLEAGTYNAVFTDRNGQRQTKKIMVK